MSYSWIFKGFTSKSINVIETGFASVEPHVFDATNLLEWSSNTRVTINTLTDGPMIITFKDRVIISKYRMLTKRSLRFPKGWDISVSYDGSSFATIDSRIEDLCTSILFYSDNYIDCGELTDRIFSIPKMMIKKIMLNITIPGSCKTYDFHICSFDVYGTTNIKEQCSCNIKDALRIVFFSQFLKKCCFGEIIL